MSQLLYFLPRSKCLLISWLQSPSSVILEPLKIKSVTVSNATPSTCHEVMGLDAMIFIFWIFRFKPAFSLPSFIFIKRLFCSSLFSAIRVMSPIYLRLLMLLLWVGKNPGEGNGNSLQYSCLGNPMDSGAWWVTVHWAHKRVRYNLGTKQQQQQKYMSLFSKCTYFFFFMHLFWYRLSYILSCSSSLIY